MTIDNQAAVAGFRISYPSAWKRVTGPEGLLLEVSAQNAVGVKKTAATTIAADVADVYARLTETAAAVRRIDADVADIDRWMDTTEDRAENIRNSKLLELTNHRAAPRPVRVTGLTPGETSDGGRATK